MSSGHKKTNIYLKKFLTQQQITTNFLDYLHTLILEDHATLVGVSGVYTYPITGYSAVPDTISILTPGETVPGDLDGPIAKADDGSGHIMKMTTAQRTNIPVPNELDQTYHVGIRFNWLPSGTEINVRTGIVKWSTLEEAIGELAKPDAVAYHNNTLSFRVDSICSDTDQFNRIVRVYLDDPVSQSSGDTYEDVSVISQTIPLEKNGGLGFVDVPNGLVQYFIPAREYTIDQTPSGPAQFIVTTVGSPNSGGTGYTRINVNIDLTSYLISNGAYITTGFNIINLSGTLGQGLSPSMDVQKYSVFMGGVTVTKNDMALDPRYAYLFSYNGTGAGNLPTAFNWAVQQELPESFAQTLLDLIRWKEYVKQRNAFMLRGGGQFTFLGGELTWNEDFYIVNPFRGDYRIPAGGITSIINNDVLYVKIRGEKDFIADGNVDGELRIADNSGYNLDDNVLIGDEDSARVSGIVKGVDVDGYLYIEDNVGDPLDLSGFRIINGAWIQQTDLELLKEQINTGELKPHGPRVIDEEIHVLAVAHTNELIFKNGVLILEDGDTGEIGNLPSGVNWVNNITELRDSVNLTSDDNVALISPKLYQFTENLSINKNLTWSGLSDRVICELDSGIDIRVAWDSSTTDVRQNTEFRRIRFINSGGGATFTVDNTGATKPMVVNILDCSFSNVNINVIKGEPTQPVIIKINGCREIKSDTAITFPTTHVDDTLYISDFKLAGDPSNVITFGDVSEDVGAIASLLHVSGISALVLLSSGNTNIVSLKHCSGLLANGRIEILNPEQATVIDNSVDVNLFDATQQIHMKMNQKCVGGGYLTYGGGTLTFSDNFDIIDPVMGVSTIQGPGSVNGISNGSILYTKMYNPHRLWANGTVAGVAYIGDTSDFNDNDMVIVGDHNHAVVGWVAGAPIDGRSISIDDGFGTPIDLSSYLISNSAWVRRVSTSIEVGTISVGDLAIDQDGKVNSNIFLFGIADSYGVTLSDGSRVERWWVYEEDMMSSGYGYGDTIQVPLDSKNSDTAKHYKVGAGHLRVYENGTLLSSDPVTPTLVVDAVYESATGIVSVDDATDMSHVLPSDTFVDNGGNQHQILGYIKNDIGSKKFKIQIGATVVDGNGSIIKKHYDEDGTIDSWQDSIVIRKDIPAGTVLKFIISPLSASGRNTNK